MKLLLVTVLICGSFLYGVAVGRYQLPPFATLIQLRKELSVIPAFAQGAAHHSARMNEFRRERGTFDVVMLGDSITESGEWNALFSCAKLANRGIAWDTSVAVLGRVDEVISRKPRLVMLMIGINDLMQGAEPAVIAANTNAVVGRLANAGARVIVQSVLFSTPQFWAPLNEKVVALNERLKAVAAAHKMEFADVNAALSDGTALREEFATDGLHLNGKAYAAWAAAIRPYVYKLAPCSGVAAR